MENSSCLSTVHCPAQADASRESLHPKQAACICIAFVLLPSGCGGVKLLLEDKLLLQSPSSAWCCPSPSDITLLLFYFMHQAILDHCFWVAIMGTLFPQCLCTTRNLGNYNSARGDFIFYLPTLIMNRCKERLDRCTYFIDCVLL